MPFGQLENLAYLPASGPRISRPNEFTGDPTLVPWLMHRGTVKLTYHQYRDLRFLTDAKQVINKKMEFYDVMTAFPLVDMNLVWFTSFTILHWIDSC